MKFHEDPSGVWWFKFIRTSQRLCNRRSGGQGTRMGKREREREKKKEKKISEKRRLFLSTGGNILSAVWRNLRHTAYVSLSRQVYCSYYASQASKFHVLIVPLTGESNSPCTIKVSLCSAHVK